MNKIMFKGRECLDQNSLELAIELVGMCEGKEVKMLINQQEIDEWKILTGKNLIETKKDEIRKKLIK
jgi:hypothetical protein